MSVITAYSTDACLDKAIAAVKGEIGDDARLVLFFSAPVFDPQSLAEGMKGAFPGATVLGCTTAGELVDDRMLKDSLVVMGIGETLLPGMEYVVTRNLRAGTPVSEALDDLGQKLGTPLAELDPSEYVGMILIDGLSVSEERVMEELGDYTDILFVGGSAGDNAAFESTYVFADGQAYTDAAILLVMKPANGFDIIKTQSLRPTSKVLTATKVDEASRLVMEFDGRPAFEAYSDALGVAPEEAAARFITNPLGLMIEGEPYVRTPQRVIDDGIVFYCNIREGMDLTVLESTDLIADTARDLDAVIGKSVPAVVVNFNCILRTVGILDQGLSEAHGSLFKGMPTLGFATYGEEYLGHLNQTATILVLR